MVTGSVKHKRHIFGIVLQNNGYVPKLTIASHTYRCENTTSVELSGSIETRSKLNLNMGMAPF